MWIPSKNPATQLSKELWQKGVVEDRSLRTILIANVYGRTQVEAEENAKLIAKNSDDTEIREVKSQFIDARVHLAALVKGLEMFDLAERMPEAYKRAIEYLERTKNR